MLRFVIKRIVHRDDVPYHTEVFETVDIDLPAIENLLTRGGFGNDGYDESHLVGVEILPASNNCFNLTKAG
jgi:hypothetical protein